MARRELRGVIHLKSERAKEHNGIQGRLRKQVFFFLKKARNCEPDVSHRSKGFFILFYFSVLFPGIFFLNFSSLINFILSDKTHHLHNNAASVSNLSKKEQNLKK